MGTSSSNPGQNGKTPLVPSWLDDDPIDRNNLSPDSNSDDNNSDRFSNSRNNFTRFVNSGGKNVGNLKSASRGYVNKSLGGSTNATKRLGSSLNSTGKLISIVKGFNNVGIDRTLNDKGLGNLIGKPLADVFFGLIDYIAPSGGRLDEGISRNSLNEAIIEFTSILDANSTDLTSITKNQLDSLTEMYVTNVIQNRLLNDIGNKLVKFSGNVDEINYIQEQLFDFINGAVKDSITLLGKDIFEVKESEILDVVQQIYKQSYDILGTIEGAD